jgi:hypothetical protein
MRWWYLALLSCYTLGLIAIITYLWIKSRNEYGLGNDDGTALFSFGWRYTPTLLAVLYIQLVMMLFEDIQRTEPFSLLARVQGAEASSTLMQRSRPWWEVLFYGVANKDGKRSWVLLCSCLVHVLAFLAIAPLSSSLLSSAEVAVSRKTEFSTMKPSTAGPLQLQPQGDTKFRTISNIVQNVTTSAWISGPYVIFPSWPTSEGPLPLGGILSQKVQNWITESMVYQLQYECQSTNMKSYKNTTVVIRNNITEIFNGIEKVVFTDQNLYPTSVELVTSYGCTYLVDLPISSSTSYLLDTGGIVWTKFSPSTYFPSLSDFPRGPLSQCHPEPDYVFMTTPWDRCDPSSIDCFAAALRVNTTTLSHICTSTYYQAELPLSIDVSPKSTEIGFNVTLFHEKRIPIPETAFNASRLNAYRYSSDWLGYLSNTISTAGQYSSLRYSSLVPSFEDAAAFLGAVYDWNLADMMQRSDIPEQASRIQARIFGELLHVSMIQPDGSIVHPQPGSVVEMQRRIVVTPEIATTLAALLALSMGLLALMCWLSRLSRRPLNLRQDPATVISTASLIGTYPTPCPRISNLDQASGSDMEFALKECRYFLHPSGMQEKQQLDSIQGRHSSKFSPIIHALIQLIPCQHRQKLTPFHACLQTFASSSSAVGPCSIAIIHCFTHCSYFGAILLLTKR